MEETKKIHWQGLWCDIIQIAFYTIIQPWMLFVICVKLAHSNKHIFAFFNNRYF